MEEEFAQEDQAPAVGSDTGSEPSEGDRQLAAEIVKRIKADKQHYGKRFKQMRRDMQIARRGATDDWPDNYYVANITGEHINNSVDALYAKNPKAVARRADRLDFSVWDEDPQTLMQAMQLMQEAMSIPPDPMTGMSPAMADPMVAQAQALIQDFQQGMIARERVSKIGRTLEILFHHFLREQTPVEFKTLMKQAVRRAKTTGVAYCELAFEREYGEPDPQVLQGLEDNRAQINHIEYLIKQLEGDESAGDLEEQKQELQYAMRSLQEQQYVLVREGLIFDFPESTRVIPDRICRNVVGFVGSRWLTVEYMYTVEEVEKLFKVDLQHSKLAKYDGDGTRHDGDQMELQLNPEKHGDGLVCVWKHFDRNAGTVYYVLDGHPGFLRTPAPPDIYVEGFWPVFALTFNDVEDPQNPIPPSDVDLIWSMQKDYNDARQGQREHRRAARPRFGGRKGALDDEDKQKLMSMEPFEYAEFNIIEGSTLADVMGPIPVPGVDPNLYETGQLFQDIELTVGTSRAAFGAASKATATAEAIAEGGRNADADSGVDDLDAFLTRLARSSGQVLLKEMSPETVKEIVGPGAVWPQVSLDEIVRELQLEIEAGSSGKPNRAQDIKNWKELLPFLVQMPGIKPEWLAGETIKRLDDKLDLTDALVEGMPAIVTQNRMQQPSPEDPAAAADQQGAEGADNGPAAPGGPTGSDAPMGNNQV